MERSFRGMVLKKVKSPACTETVVIGPEVSVAGRGDTTTVGITNEGRFSSCVVNVRSLAGTLLEISLASVLVVRSSAGTLVVRSFAGILVVISSAGTLVVTSFTGTLVVSSLAGTLVVVSSVGALLANSLAGVLVARFVRGVPDCASLKMEAMTLPTTEVAEAKSLVGTVVRPFRGVIVEASLRREEMTLPTTEVALATSLTGTLRVRSWAGILDCTSLRTDETMLAATEVALARDISSDEICVAILIAVSELPASPMVGISYRVLPSDVKTSGEAVR